MKEQNIYDVIQEDGRFSILAKILDRSGIGSFLSVDPDAVTLFAPTDEAFEKLPRATLSLLESPEGKDFAFKLLSGHLIPSSYLYADDLRHAGSVRTLNGHKASISTDNDVLKIGMAHVLTPGIASRNGVIFPIDRVLTARRRRASGA